MERIVFLLRDGTRLSCMLNPESILARRQAGIARRASGVESITGRNLTDDPLLYTGGGVTEYILELLFDLAVAGSTVNTSDIRELTGPLWRLSENSVSSDGEPRLPVVRLIWGKTWNVAGVVAQIAERLEAFGPSGAPRRSLITMQFLRVNDDDDQPRPAPALSSGELAAIDQLRWDTVRGASAQARDSVVSDRIVRGRADVIASSLYRTESLWRLVLAPNGISEPFQDLTGQPLTLLPRSVLGGTHE